jgi:hypothetical protein
MAAGEIDFAGDAFSYPRCIFGLGHFADEFMAGSTAKTVISALQFQIGGADSCGQQANARKALGNSRKRLPSQFDASVFKMYCEHCSKSRITASFGRGSFPALITGRVDEPC